MGGDLLRPNTITHPLEPGVQAMPPLYDQTAIDMPSNENYIKLSMPQQTRQANDGYYMGFNIKAPS